MSVPLQLFCLLVYLCHAVQGQTEDVPADESCYGGGTIALSVILTLILGCLLAALVYFLWNKYWKARKGQHLFLETDPEKGKGEYAFDNPGFRDAGLSPIGKSAEKAGSKLESNLKTRWNQWSTLGALTTKNEKKRTLDDSELEHQIKNVSLRSHDFAGLGFNICGNMKDGIFIKDILHRGPASESKKLNAGDRIQSVTISFEHMVYEDALAILSYASPYEIIVSAKNGKAFNYSGQVGRPLHPVYRSSSNMELHQMEKSSKKRLFDDSSDFGSNYSSLQKNHNSMVPSLERSRSKSPKPVLKATPKTKIDVPIENKELRPGQKAPRKIETEMQNTENKVHKFGIQVLPLESPTKSAETQNVNNVNHENELVAPIRSIDEVDKFKSDNQFHFENETSPVKQQAPPVKKREKLQQQSPQKATIEPHEEMFQRNNSGIRRDENNIPLEMPSTMMNAAVAARKNRKSVEEEELKSPKKKGKAPAPPEAGLENKTSELLKGDLKGYNSDSDVEADNQSSVNTIELNASDITIHQSEDSDEKQNRKTASTGDLSKIQKTRKTSTGTLERAQSLDITDTGMPTLTAKKRKAAKCEEFESKTSSDESLYGSSLVNKEPRLSLILDGLNTFQRSRLKKSTEWGNLEDAILNLDKQGSHESTNQNSSEEEFKISTENFDKNFNFGAKSPEFDALVNKINEIKQETMDIIKEQDKHIKEVEISKEEVSHIIETVKNGIESDLLSNEELCLKIEDEPMPQIIQTVEEFEIAEEPIVTPAKRNKNIIWPFNAEESSIQQIKLDDAIPQIETQTTTMITTDITPISSTTAPISVSQVSKPMVSEIEISVQSNTPLPTKAMHAEPIKINEPKIVNVNEKDRMPVVNLAQVTDFLQAERTASAKYVPEIVKHEDTNIPDDIKVSRHSFASVEKPINENVKNVHVSNVSNITINHQPKYDDVNEKSNDDAKVYKGFSITTPDLIKNLTIAEVIHDVNNEVTIDGPTSLTLEISNVGATSDDNKIEIKQQNGIQMKPNGDINKLEVAAPNDIEDNRHSSLTYITEIQVTTPQKETIPHREVEIVEKNEDKLDNDFEHYIKKFENNIKTFESNINNFEANIQSIAENINTVNEVPTNEIVPKPAVTTVTEVISVDPEKELQKVHEIVEEQLKRLPEMRFTTSTYESHIKPPEKRMSQIEILRSNFEKSNSPPRHIRSEASPPKSRIPVLNKTPPTSPERRDSRADNEQDTKEILEMMASRIPSKNKNVTVTSIRNNSRIPSGLPTYGNKPPVPPKKSESIDDIVHVSANGGSGNVESFRQWVFNPNDQSITNITVTESKYDSSIHK